MKNMSGIEKLLQSLGHKPIDLYVKISVSTCVSSRRNNYVFFENLKVSLRTKV